jgi:release factor glutamine methyltransferase
MSIADAGPDDRGAIDRAMREGRASFLDLEILVARGALVPRQETELLARTAIERLRANERPELKVIDVCCGAGNLACAIAHHVPSARVWATDLTDPCVELTRKNVSALGLAERVSVHQGDLFAALAPLGLTGAVDAIVCNPPYISEKRLEEDRAALLDLEPREAFAAGPYGLAIHQRVIREALPFLREGGVLLVEIGAGQQRQVEILFNRAREYVKIAAVRDAAGEARVVMGQRRCANTES